MKKLSISLLGILMVIAFNTNAQTYDTTSFYGKMNYLYANINKAPIITGLLRDYGIDFQNLDNYTGTALHDSNYTSLADWRMLYGSLYSQQITSTPSLLYLDTLNKRFSEYGIMGDPISFVAMYYNYQTINPNGVSNNQFTISNNQLFDVNGRSGSPYLINDVFAIATTRQLAITGDNEFIFRNDLFFGNTGKTISTIQVDAFGTGSYQTVSIGTGFTVHYDTAGVYNINIQITYTDNTVKYAHTKLAVHIDPATIQARYGTGFTPPTNETVIATKPYMGVLGQGDITIDLAKNNTTGQIRKPLIVVEGFDPDGGFRFNGTDGLIPRLNTNINDGNPLTNAITLNTGLDDINDYDLIFVNWQNGTDYIQRNAFLLERVIQIVNARKTTWNGVRQDNVIIGMSMGGLVVRYALRDMELNSLAHETRLFISHDAPHNGANVPVGYQALVQYLAPWKVINVGGNFPFIQWPDMFPQAVDAMATFNSPAAKQILIQRYLLQSSGGGTFSSLSYSLAADNTVHNDFMIEINNMGWPVNCRNITLANGACNGTFQFADNSKLVSIYGEKSWTYFGGMWRSLVASFAGIVNATNIPTLGSVPINNNSLLVQLPLSVFSTKTNLFFDFGAWAVPPSGNNMLFQGDVYIHRQLFFGLFSTNSYILKCHANSTSSMLALDNAPGGVYDLNQFGFNINTVNQQLHNNLGSWINATVQQPRFCFVPTVSSLAFDNPSQYYRSAICDIVNCHNPSAVANYYAPSANQLHISYTQANADWILQNQEPTFACPKICKDNLVINGNDPLCNNAVYTINNPTGTSVSWSTTPSTSVTLTPNGNQVTLQRSGGANGILTLTANVTGGCGNTGITASKQIYIGVLPGSTQMYFNNTSYSNYTTNLCLSRVANYEVYIDPILGASSYYWSIGSPSAVSLNSGQGTNSINVTVYGTPGSPLTFAVQPVNNCGYGYPIQVDGQVCGLGNQEELFRLSPNPSSNNINIETINLKSNIKEIKILDKLNNLKKHSTYSLETKKSSINISFLPSDVYYIQVFDGKKWSTYKFIKN